MIFETPEQLDECVAKWQKILRLQDWDVAAKIVRKRDLLEGKAANVTWVCTLRAALIEIMDQVDVVPTFDGSEIDQEREVVHELLHLSLDEAGHVLDDDSRHLGVERHIEALAKALVSLDRASISPHQVEVKL